ncbi:unnamed protein product [Cylicocyclus nassatus]|uniref:Uncharacterized protein n=1 Tax=Cylicocyclus nassatus TaxID=53992 RepID=A0AA36M592_CYLNA|nr:unnamed protein product [Cylicocyclus nassatus]
MDWDGQVKTLRKKVGSDLQASMMPVKYMDEWPKKKAPPFNEIEAGRLVALYCENYDSYHGKTKWGKNIVSEKQRFLREWSKEISSMGYATRTKDQVEEKIRNEVKKVKKYLKHIKTEKSKRKGDSDGKARVWKLPLYLDPLVELISHLGPEHGTSGAAITHNHPEYDLTRAAKQLLTPAQEPHFSDRNISPENEGDLELCGPTDTTDTNGSLFDDRKPTREELRELRAKLGMDTSVILEDPSTCNKHKSSLDRRDSANCITTGSEETPKSTTRMDRELHCSLTSQRLKLCEEKTKLTKMKQEEVAIRLEEAKASLQLRLIELERAKVELERVRGVGTERESPAPTPPTSIKSNGA